ncbi:MAG: class I adenylate-forming enzyme family protein [Halobacteriota archaeon]|nr:class I adenylate-forming enzyme family protein [Halobacteriota archaeon]
MASTIREWFSNCVKSNPDGISVIYGDRRITWKELNDRVNRLSNALWDLGVRKGDKVTFMFHDSPEFLESNYAIQKIGAIPVPMNFRFVSKDIEYQANHSDSTIFIFEDIWWNEVNHARPKLPKVKHFICSGKKILRDTLDYEELMGKCPPTEPPKVEIADDDPQVMIYTGGTTGYPKGVILTHDNHRRMVAGLFGNLPDLLTQVTLSPETISNLSNLFPVPGIAEMLGGGQPPPALKQLSSMMYDLVGTSTFLRLMKKVQIRVLWPGLPLFHEASYPQIAMHTLQGITLVLHRSIHYDPKEIMELVEKEKPIILGNGPTTWKRLVEFPEIDNYDKSSVLIMITGSAVAHAELKKKMLTKFKGAVIVDVFGQTEMSPGTTVRVDADIDKIADRSVGIPIVETRIVNDKGDDVKRGAVGEIIYRGPTIMKGYYKDEQKTKEVIKDGWFYSGDLGWFDEKGEVHVVERKAECINSGGEKIYPNEVEEVILQNPKVDETCVIGVPDTEWGEFIRAVVKLNEGETATEEEIIDWCRGKITGYKRPKSVVFVNSLPHTPVGKVLRKQIREMYVK